MSRKIQRSITSETELPWFSAVCHEQWSEPNERFRQLPDRRGSGRAQRERPRYNGVRGMDDIKGKVARVATTKLGNKRVSISREDGRRGGLTSRHEPT
jgi:hypothetical protein